MTMTEQSSSSPADDAVPGPARVTGRQLRELLADDMWLDELTATTSSATRMCSVGFSDADPPPGNSSSGASSAPISLSKGISGE